MQYTNTRAIIRYLEPQEVESIIGCISNRMHKLLIRLIYEGALRVGEAVTRKAKHLNIKDNTIFIPHEETKVGRKRLREKGVADKGGGNVKIRLFSPGQG